MVDTADSPRLSASASLDISNGFYDMLEGSTREEKTTLVLQSMLRNAATRYAPTEQKFTYTDNVTSVNAPTVFMAALDIAWKFLGANAPQLALAGIPVAFSFLQGLINQKYGGYQPVTIQYQPASISGPNGTAVINISGVSAKDIGTVITGIQGIIASEAARQQPPPNAPANLPTPDPVVSHTLTLTSSDYSGTFFGMLLNGTS